MTPQLIQLKSLPNVALVQLPRGVPIPDVINTGQPHLSWLDIDIDLPDINLPPGNWRIVSTLADITEKQAHGLVEKVISDQHYQNYNYKSVAERWVKTALESFHSAIRASGWLLENTYPSINDPKFYDEPYDGSGFYQELYSGALDDWKQRQSRTLNPELTLILTKD